MTARGTSFWQVFTFLNSFRQKICLTPKKRSKNAVAPLASAARILAELNAAKLTFFQCVGGPGGGLEVIKDVLWFTECLGEDGVKAVDTLVYMDHVEVHSALQSVFECGTLGSGWVGHSAGFLKMSIKGSTAHSTQRTQRIFKEFNGCAENLRIVYTAWSVWILQTGTDLTKAQWAALLPNSAGDESSENAKDMVRALAVEDLAAVNEFWTKYGSRKLCPSLWWVSLSEDTKTAIKAMSRTARKNTCKEPNFQLVAEHGVLPTLHEWVFSRVDGDLKTIDDPPATIHVLRILALSGQRSILQAILQASMRMKDASDYVLGCSNGLHVYKHLSGFTHPDVDKCVSCKSS